LPGTQTDLQPFRPRFPWWGGDLQTLRNYLTRGGWDLSSWPSERLYFQLEDGSGDRLQAVLHRREGAPVAVLVHGLTGCEESFYVLETARFLLSKGFSVLRMNLRGAGPSRKTCTGHYCAGSSAELAAVLRQLPKDLIAPGLVLVGYSLGGNVVLKYLAERPMDVAPACAVSISAPIDLAAASARMMDARNRLYHGWLLKRMATEAVSGGVELSDGESNAIGGARTVFEFDDRFVAPRNGFDGAVHYYQKCSAAAMLPAIDTPVLLIHARNDPWIPSDAYERLGLPPSAPVSVALSDSGGHVGFHGTGLAIPWHNTCIYTYSLRHLSNAPNT
jgi:uncharacterized protein